MVTTERETFVEGLGAIVVGQECHQQAPVLLLSDPAAIVALPCEVVDGLELHLIRRFVDEHPQLPGGDPQVVLRELVRDIPAQGPEESPFLDHRMEETQAIEKPLEVGRRLALFEEFLVADGVHEVRTDQVGTEALRCFIGDLHTVLQDGDRELLRRIRRQPQPEVRVGLLGIQLLEDLVQLRHPGCVEVAILQQDPAPHLHALLHHLFRFGTLPLAQREAVDLLALLCRKHVQRRGWVRARREDEDQRCDVRGVLIAPCDVEGRGRDKFLTHLLSHIL
mmetsp:Transcript_42957/g.91558  ORF Transcript_42957/g.91558 Transcript_42957/m.91558 type:complete len:279 (+) Transcript_42957:1063-1899(+)